MKSETCGTAWKCSTCDKEFKYESEKRRHEQSHIPQFECKVCSKKFSFVSALRRHEKQHGRTESVQCSKCGGRFRDETLLKRHIQYAHKGTYQCKKCSSIFNSEIALGLHMKTHISESERKFHCSYDGCRKSFNFAHHLKHHELTHTNDRPHECTECGKRFIQLHHLKIHQRAHQPDSWLTCPVLNCYKEFTNEYALKRHIATHKNKDENSSKSSAKVTTKTGNFIEIKPLRTWQRNSFEDTRDITKEILNLSVSSPSEMKQESSCSENQSVNSTEIINKISDSDAVSIEHDNDNEDLVIKDNFEEFDTEGVTVDENVDIDDIDLSVSNCKSVLGKCIETGDSEPNESCLCAKLTTAENSDDLHEANIPKTDNNVQVHFMDDLRCIEKRRNDVNACETCECASICGIRDKAAVAADFIEFETRNDTVIKIKDSFDMDFEIINNANEEILENKYRTKIKVDMINSCKDILGNCIVSGNGTIGEGCLCARMTADDQQIIAQEIEDLTPCPKQQVMKL